MHSSESWVLEVDPDVVKVLEHVPRHDAERMLGAIKLLSADPYFGDIQKMKGEENVWRRRIGSYRIFYKIRTAEKVVLIFRLERRTSQTY